MRKINISVEIIELPRSNLHVFKFPLIFRNEMSVICLTLFLFFTLNFFPESDIKER